MSTASDTLTPPGFAEAPAPAARVRLWKRGWFRLAVLAAISTILIVAALIGLITSTAENRVNDPTSYSDVGAAAVANLVGDQGVDVSTSYDVAQATDLIEPGSTFVVANPDVLTAAQWRAVLARKPADLVVLSGEQSALTELGAPVTVNSSPGAPTELAPSCADPDAARAGSVLIALTQPSLVVDTAPRYKSDTAAVRTCYEDSKLSAGAGYARYTEGETTVHLFAGGLQNAHLDQAGNASLSMALLGRHSQLVWLTAQRDSNPPAETGPDGAPILVLPQGWGWAVAMAFFTLGIVAIWRGRRLGPILEENLPVRIRASETVEGHGRLYFRNDARARAADILREASRNRLAAKFGQSDPQALISLISTRVGVPDAEIGALLFGAPPGTDAELIGLQDSLQHLETEVRRL